MNKALLGLLECTSDEVKGVGYIDAFVFEEDREAVQKVFEQIVREGKGTILTNRIVSKSGKIYLVEWHSQIASDENFFIGIGIDVTARNLAEKEKRSLKERLSRAEKMEAIGLLAGGVAHDLNNILSAIVGYPELMLFNLPEDSKLREPLNKIKASGQKAADVVQDLLTLARRGVATRQILDINRIISTFLGSPEFKRISSDHQNVQLDVKLEPGILNISGSQVHLEKTILNLVANACESMRNGGKLAISTSSQYIDNPIQGYDEIAEGDYTILTIADEGDGISDNDLGSIFEPFYSNKVMGRSGTGLGLTIVWGTVKDHGGYIDVSSKKGNGTTFTLYFPATRDNLPSDITATSISEYMGNGELILVIDDIKEQRELAYEILSTLNYAVATIASGEEAVEYFKNGNHADLIVLDMIMEPGINGLDTYRKILEIKPGQRAIIASGFSESEQVLKTQELGAGSYVRKPYTREKLGLAVKQELDQQ